MGLGGALQIGRSALTATRAAIEATGNNLANIATAGYRRQKVTLEPVRNQELQAGQFVGRGVQIQSIVRQVNEALEGRVRNAISSQSGTQAQQQILTQIEAIHNEFTDADVSSQLNSFFNAFSELANNPRDNSLRTLVQREADSLSVFLGSLRDGLTALRSQVDGEIEGAATRVNNLLEQISVIDRQVVQGSRGQQGAPGLRDQRDLLLAELSQYVDISTIEQASGSIDVFVGSIPILLNGVNRGVEVRRRTVDGELALDLVLKADGSLLNAKNGRLGSLFDIRRNDVNSTIQSLDKYINTFVFEINKAYSQGQGLTGFESVVATNRVKDTAQALNEPDELLNFTPVHGSFALNVTQKSTGERITTMINVDLDGIESDSDTSLESLAAQIDAVDDVSATITPDGRLSLTSGGSDFEFSFSDDSSGVLAALGINTFFVGDDAGSIGVNPLLVSNPGLMAVARDHIPGDNQNALAVADLREQPLASLGQLSLIEGWNRYIEDIAVKLGQANIRLESNTVVVENLQAQQQQASGVNADEEAVNLLGLQRAYQSSARFLQVVDELMDTLLSLV